MSKSKSEIRLLAMGYLWDKTQGKASQEAMRSFSEGAAWAFELLSGNESATSLVATELRNSKESEAEYEIGNNE